MSRLLDWNGVEIDIDVTELDGWELSEIKKKVGLTYRDLIEGLQAFDGDSIRALFWIAERRHRPELTFGDYRGPTVKFLAAHMDALVPEGFGNDDDPGKAGGEIPATNGSPSSPNGSAGLGGNTTI